MINAKKRGQPANSQTVFGATILPKGETSIDVEIHPQYMDGIKPQIVATANVAVSVSVPHADGDRFTLAISEPFEVDIDISWSMTVGPRSPFKKREKNFFDDNNPPKRKSREDKKANKPFDEKEIENLVKKRLLRNFPQTT